MRSEGLAGLACQLNLAGDLVAHEGIEVLERGAGDRLELRVPPRLPSRRLFGRHGGQAVDLGQVPAARQKTLHQRAGESRKQIHADSSAFSDRARTSAGRRSAGFLLRGRSCPARR